MLKLATRSALVALLLAGPLAAFAGEEAPAKLDEAKLIAVLKSDAPQFEKAEACRLLQRCATKAAVPALAALLADEKLSHMARYALEPLPDPSADEALRAALGKTKGRLLAGVATSLGVRRDAKAVDALARLLGDADTDVAEAAARALGSIGTAEAAAALEPAVAKAPAARQVAFCEGLFRAAECLAEAGDKAKALAAYESLRGLKQAPHQVRAGALRGVILTRGDEGIPLLLEAVRGSDGILARAATRAAMELPGPAVAKALADELGKLSPENQILVTFVLGKRADAAAVPALLALAKKGDTAARIAAIRTLPEIGNAAAVPVLVTLLGDAEANVATAAKDALAALPGDEVDAALVAMLGDQDAKTRSFAIDMIGQRRVAGAVPALLKAAEDPDEAVRLASLKVVGEVAGAAELPALIALLLKGRSPAELQAAERAVTAACARQAQPAAGKVVILKAVYGALPDGPSADVAKKITELLKAGATSVEASNANFGDPANGIVKKLRVEYTVDGVGHTATVGEGDTVAFTASVTPPAVTEALCAPLAQAPAAAKLALLRILRSTGSPKALEAVRAATKDAAAEVQDAAVSLLCDWPTADALPDVARLAKTATSPRVKILALRGIIRLTPLQAIPAEERLASLKEVLPLIERTEEKRLLLAALAALPTAESLALVTPHLDNQALKEEASLAAVAIAEKVIQTHPAQVAEAMREVTQVTGNKQTARRARILLDQARKAAPKK